MAQRMTGVDNRRTDTRDRIVAVALRLFSDQGYAATSLREIADELGVTKAALYFHFKTKEDILAAILRGRLDAINAVVDAVTADLTTLGGREELLRRFADSPATRNLEMMRFMREASAEIRSLPMEAEIHETRTRLLDALAGPEPTLLDRTRARTALMALQSVALLDSTDDSTEDDLRAAALVVALEIIRGGRPTEANH